jgi:hypothetical protein
LSVTPSISTAAPSTSSGIAENAKTTKPAQSLGFGDFLDVINPLQHIPIIGSLYRAITGDAMSPTAEVVGGALFGGLVGAVTSLADVVFTQATGRDFGDTVLAWLGVGKNVPGATQFAVVHKASQDASLSVATGDRTTATRAAFAYRRAVALQEPAPAMGLSLRH